MTLDQRQLYRRHSLTLTLFSAIAVLIPPDAAHAQIKHWNTGDGNWSNPANWTPFGIPVAPQLVQIGSLPQAANMDVQLNVNTVIGGLNLTNGMRLHTNGHSMQTLLDTEVSGTAGFSILEIEGVPASSGYTTRDLILDNDGLLLLADDGQLNVGRTMYTALGGQVQGHGVIQLDGNAPVSMVNDGTIFVGHDSLSVNQNGSGVVDLDGLSGNGVVTVGTPLAFTNVQSLTFNLDQLADTFSGTINISPGALLNMNVLSGWLADAGSQIDFIDYGDETNAAKIQGSHLTLAAVVNAYSDEDFFVGDAADITGQFDSAVTIQNSASVNVGTENGLAFTGTTTIEGGSLVMGQDAKFRFDGPTTMQGGVFTTHNNNEGDGFIAFNGPTTWNGNVTVNGAARQQGNATVSGNTTINAGVIDLDGFSGNTTWDINALLAVNAEAIDILGGNLFNGTVDVGVGIFPQLAINLDSPDDFWSMGGQMFLANNFPFPQTRVSGSPMQIVGDLFVNGANVRITAETDFADTSNTTFETGNTSLFMSGTTTVKAGALFMGAGTFINGTSGQLRLEGGASLNELALRNQGLLEIGDATGIADVASFESTADARWQVEIGGHIAGAEHDVLLVGNGDAVLDGRLSVKLIDAGNGLFVPAVGDEFTILSTVGNVVGQFDNAPISISGDTGYQWEVFYNTNDVTLRLNSTIPGLVLGDVNGDGSVSLLDVAPFVNAITTGTYIIQADINCDGSVDLLDVSLFVELLTG